MGGNNSSPSSLNYPSSRGEHNKRKQYTGEYKNERKKIKSDKYAGMSEVEKVEDMADFLTRLDLMDHTSEFFAKEDIASLRATCVN